MPTKQRPPKPFPHRCPECGAAAVYAETTDYKTAFKHEGRLHEFVAPNITLNKCRDCGGVILPNTAIDQIAEAFQSMMQNHLILPFAVDSPIPSGRG